MPSSTHFLPWKSKLQDVSQASGPALSIEMYERVRAVIKRGSGDSAAPLFSVCAYTGYGKRDLRVNAHTDAQGWQITITGKAA